MQGRRAGLTAGGFFFRWTMPREPITPSESYQDMLFPTAGIDVSGPFGMQRKGTTPVGINVRAFEASTNRQRGGSRPGISKYVSDQISGDNRVQCIENVITTSGTIPGSTTAGGTLALYYLTPIPNPTLLNRSNGTTVLWTYPHDNGAGDNEIAGTGDTVAQVDRIGAGTTAAGQIITGGALVATVSLAPIAAALPDYRMVLPAAGSGYCYFLGRSTGDVLTIVRYTISPATTTSATSASWPLFGWTIPGSYGRVRMGTGSYADRMFLSSNTTGDGIFQVKAPELDTSLTYAVVTKASIDAQVSGYIQRTAFAQAGNVLAIPIRKSGDDFTGLVFYNMSTAAFVYTAISGIASLSGIGNVETDGTDFYLCTTPTGSTGVVRKYSGTDGTLQWTSSSFSIPLSGFVDFAYTA